MLLQRKLICSGDHVGQAPPGTDQAAKGFGDLRFAMTARRGSSSGLLASLKGDGRAVTR
jgi:hypothetical protein